MPALYTRNETVARGAVAQYYGSQDVVRVERLWGDAGGLQEVSMHEKGFRHELSEEWIAHTLTIHDKMSHTLNLLELYGKPGVEPKAKSPITAIMEHFGSLVAETAHYRPYSAFLSPSTCFPRLQRACYNFLSCIPIKPPFMLYTSSIADRQTR